MGLPGTPKLDAKLDQNRTKLGPNGARVGDFIDPCLHLCVHVRPRTYQNLIRGALEPQMLPKCSQHAKAEGYKMHALPIRNTLVRFRSPGALGTPLAPHLCPIYLPSWSQVGAQRDQVGAKLAPRGTQDPLENDHKTTQTTEPKKALKIHATNFEKSGETLLGSLK